AYMQLSSLT
nr:immunoglobulin heavy chain junction region [Mus musculus]